MSILVIALILLGCSVLITAASNSYVSKHTCTKCGSRDTSRSIYTRGWNHLCSQACGSWGHYCRDCGHIDFESTDEQYISTLPDWCDHPKRPIDPVYVWTFEEKSWPEAIEKLRVKVYEYVTNSLVTLEQKNECIQSLYEKVYKQGRMLSFTPQENVDGFINDYKQLNK